MNTGKTLFAQLMDFLPWTTFTTGMAAIPGPDAFLRRAIPVHGLRPADLPGKPARHRDLPLGPRIDLSHGLPSRSGARLADANERRDWRIHAALAQRLITQARTLYERTGVGPDQYRLRPGLDDHRSVPVGLSVGALPHHQGGGHTLLDLRGNIPSFIHISDGKLHDGYALAGSRSHLRRGRGYVDFGEPGPSSSRVQVEHRCSSIRRRRIAGIMDQTINGFYTRQDYPELLRRIRFKDPESGMVFITNSFRPPPSALQKPLAGGTLLQVDQAASSDFYGTSENAVKTQIGLPSRSTSSSPSSRSASTWTPALHFVTDPLGDPLRENAHTSHLRETKTDATLRK